MNKTWRLAAFAGLLGMLCAANGFASQLDEAAIRDVQTRQAAAWNAHDAVA